MELRQLKYFQTIGRLNSITKAAVQLNVSQPSLTVAMQNLEEELGVLLFERSYRNISLTSAGAMFLKHVDDILLRVDDSVREITDYRTKRAGTIKIGIPPMIGVFVFSYILGQFRKLHPEFELTIVERGSLSVLRLLEKGKLDVGFVVLGDALDGVEVMPVTCSEIKVCMRREHPLSGLSAVPIAALREEAFILLKEDTYNRRLIIEECKKNQYSPNIIFSTRQVQTIINMVEQGVGISFLIDAVSDKQQNIISRPLCRPLVIEAGLAWRKDRYITNALRIFINFIEKAFNNL
ncbi:LysR family transcriptional regulator [Acetonema longum]|uniref:LysR family transcriptional regulator n=1 Tax=Acetonema longum DSM 6540 TaxID=1009370 RepID=F7NPT7_9FIRM|nr:LysR family transcriptional regulator [Acetonema longum]EGO61928.1 LysR family transcriptional regulator [Acetonema longum DSM 6540]